MDLRTDDGMAALKALLRTADVFIENFRPGTLEQMGLAPDALLADNPDLVVVRISGFGQTGPYAHLPGFGSIVEGMSGFAHRNGFADREPVLPPLALADMIAGVYGSSAVVTALFARERGTARGQVIDLSLLEPIVSVLGPEAALYRVAGKTKMRSGSASNTSSPRNVYRCRDGRYLAVSGSTPQVARRILEVIGRADMLDDPRFATNEQRVKYRDLVDDAVGAWFAQHDHDEALEIMREAGATVGPILTPADAAIDAHFLERAINVEAVDTDYGSLPMHNIVPRLSETPGVWQRPAPTLGEHNDEILTELGFPK
jgi:crotonobetainyl-CoA:carnitine CoA-transferase CaiB-like acyl-CoA transferase